MLWPIVFAVAKDRLACERPANGLVAAYHDASFRRSQKVPFYPKTALKDCYLDHAFQRKRLFPLQLHRLVQSERVDENALDSVCVLFVILLILILSFRPSLKLALPFPPSLHVVPAPPRPASPVSFICFLREKKMKKKKTKKSK